MDEAIEVADRIIIFNSGKMVFGHYSTDTYRLIEMGYNKYSIEYSLNDGRIFMYIIGQIAAKINININMYVILLTFLAIIISVICIILIEKILKKYNKREQSIIVALIAYVTIMNFMYLENLYFTECIVMAMSILLYIIAAKMLNEGGNILKIFLLVLLGVFCYQGTINVFITFYFLFALIENKTINKTILKNMCIVLGISLISIAINMLQIKLCGKIYGLEQTRTGKINEIWFNIVYIIKNIDTLLIQSSDLFPKYVFLIFLTLTSNLFCISITPQFNLIANIGGLKTFTQTDVKPLDSYYMQGYSVFFDTIKGDIKFNASIYSQLGFRVEIKDKITLGEFLEFGYYPLTINTKYDGKPFPRLYDYRNTDKMLFHSIILGIIEKFYFKNFSIGLGGA